MFSCNTETKTEVAFNNKVLTNNDLLEHSKEFEEQIIKVTDNIYVAVSFGYNFDKNIAFKLTSGNLFDSKYRPIANAPFIGRTILGQLTLHFD